MLNMLTDIFAIRYADRPIWSEFREADRVLLVQGFRMVAEQLFPPNGKGVHEYPAKSSWSNIQSRLSMELGMESLSPLNWGYYNQQNLWMSGAYSMDHVCKTWMLSTYDGKQTADTFMKQRISFIELSFRERMSTVKQEVERAASLLTSTSKVSSAPQPLSTSKLTAALKPAQEGFAKLKNSQAEHSARFFRSTCDELNERFKQAKIPLSYHAGFVQVAGDSFIEESISKPFWSVIADPKWNNVTIDMAEAVDRRESAQRDPALYAAKALESVLKIISDEKGWTTGKEKSASNYIDNLRSGKNGAFVAEWEAEGLRHFFSRVRNELGHGPGGEPMPQMTQQQTEWAISIAMAWTKSMVTRV